MAKKIYARLLRLDIAAKTGIYTMPRQENEVKYNLRAISQFAAAKGINPANMTDSQLEPFRIKAIKTKPV